MQYTQLDEGQVIQHIAFVGKGRSIGYGPAKEKVKEDSFMIRLEGDRERMSPLMIPATEVDTVKEMLEQSYNTEKEELDSRNSITHVFSSKMGMREFLDQKIQMSQGDSPFQKLEYKYDNLEGSVDAGYKIHEERLEQEKIDQEIDNQIKNKIDNTIFEGREDILNELQNTIKNNVAMKGTNQIDLDQNFDNVPENMREQYKEIMSEISEEVKQSLAEKSTLKRDNRHKPSIYNR